MGDFLDCFVFGFGHFEVNEDGEETHEDEEDDERERARSFLQK